MWIAYTLFFLVMLNSGMLLGPRSGEQQVYLAWEINDDINQTNSKSFQLVCPFIKFILKTKTVKEF